MGLSTSKSKSTSTPYAPAAPAIASGLTQAQEILTAQQPILTANAQLAQDAFKQIAPTAFVKSPFVSDAQTAAGRIANGAYYGTNPGASTYANLQTGVNPSLGTLGGLASQNNNPAYAALGNIANVGNLNYSEGSNPATGFATDVAGGKYLNAQPSAGLYKDIIGGSQLTGNPYIDDIVRQTNEGVTTAANRRFAASGMGAGLSSAFGDVLSKNLANNESTLRYNNYNDAATRQLAAAGQSDSAFANERGQMTNATNTLQSGYDSAQARALQAAQANQNAQLSAAGTLGSLYNTGQANQINAAGALGSQFTANQNTQLNAAQAADGSQQSQIAQMLQALGLVPGLESAQYAGIAPASGLLNSASTIPYAGLNAYGSAVNGLAGQYGTTTGTQTQSALGGLTSLAGGVGGLLAGGALAFSDPKLKTDKEKVGKLGDDLNLYRFRYKGDDEEQVGVMADEVAKKRPWALGPKLGGYRTVDYGRL